MKSRNEPAHNEALPSVPKVSDPAPQAILIHHVLLWTALTYLPQGLDHSLSVCIVVHGGMVVLEGQSAICKTAGIFMLK